MKRVMIIAGEASGDTHAAKLVREVKAKRNDIEFFGIGGKHMRATGVDTLIDSSVMAVVGLFEVLAHWNTLSSALKQMQSLIRDNPPDLLVLVDYPDFNLRLAKTAKQHGVKVLFYISPQIWAWRQKRVFKIKKLVDMMAVVFPFEAEFYRKYDVPVQFVGHPLVDEIHVSATKESLKQEFGLNNDHPVVGLLPGSRQSEIKRLLPVIIESAKQLQAYNKNIQFIVPVASTLDEKELSAKFAASGLSPIFISHRSHDAMSVCDCVITVSGTVTLELALLRIPMVVINRISWLSYFFVGRMLKIEDVALCNIVAGKRIVPEYIQDKATPENIINAMKALIDNDEERTRISHELAVVNEKLSNETLQVELSDLLIKML